MSKKGSKIEFTGERYIPGVEGQVEIEHYHRYKFAKEYVKNKKVLDIACGEGYGSEILSEVAANVIGVDVDKDVINASKNKYKNKNIKFLHGSADSIPIASGSVDIVVSFETIEHHEKHNEMLREIKRVLKPKGKLIISSPDKLEYTDKPKYKNPYHVKELYLKEFQELLGKYFQHVYMFGQKVLYGSAIISKSKVEGSTFYHHDKKRKYNYLPNPIYDIAIASDDKIVSFKNSIYEQDILKSEFIKERDGNIQRLKVAFSELESHVHNHQNIIADRDSKAKSVEQLQSQIEEISSEYKEYISKLNSELESVIVDRDSKAKGIEQLQSQIEEISSEHLQHIENLNITLESVIKDRDANINGINKLQSAYDDLLTDKGALQNNLSELVKVIESLTIDRDSQAAGLQRMLSEYDNLSNELDESKELNKKLLERNEELDSQFEKASNELNKMYKSKLWRILAILKGWDRKESDFSSDNKVANSQYLSSNLHVKKSGKNILLVSYYFPTKAHAGGLRILDIYSMIKEKCPDVKLDLLSHNRHDIDWNIDEAYSIFENIYLSPSEELTPRVLKKLTDIEKYYDVIDLQFHQCGYYIDEYRKIGNKIIFTPMESLAKVLYLDLKAMNLATSLLSLRKLSTAIRYASEEISFLPKVDEVVCVSKADAAFLRTVSSLHNIKGVDTGVSQYEFADALLENYEIVQAAHRPCRVLYIAYFGSETNINALQWYLDKVHCLVKEKVPEYIFTIVGRGDLSSFEKYKDNSIEFVGEVAELAPYIKKARVGIAPALSGSGFRGKVNQYAVLGVPSVVTPISHKGLSYTDGEEIFVAKSAKHFAECCSRLLIDTKLNDRMGSAARNLSVKHYTWQSKWDVIKKIYMLED